MNRISIVLLFSVLITAPAFSQKKELKTKFGKLSEKEIAMTSYSDDPSAPAVVLFDKGELSHRYDDNHGFILNFERNMRVKIFKNEAFGLADISVLHYRDAKVGEIKASSFNLENGKMVETKLEKANIFEEEITKNLSLTKFLIPAVKEGSIIEFTYTISSNGGLAMPDSWVFQRSHVPTVWSEFKASVPAFIDYKKMSQGWTEYSLAEEGQEDSKLNITYKDRSDGLVATTKFENIAVDYTISKMHFIQENIPALKPEDFVNSTDDYLSSINFDIRTVYETKLVSMGNSYRLVNGLPNAYNRTWGGMGRELLEDIYGKDIKSVKSLEDVAKTAIAGKTERNDKIAAIYEYIGTNFQLKNSYDRIFKTQTMDDLVKNHRGTPTDLNLLFMNMMSKIGLEAFPVLISTNDHGRVKPFRVSTDEFNRLIAGVQLEDSTVLLVDMAGFPNPMGLLPPEDLASSGLKLHSENDIDWVPIQNKISVKSAVIANLKLLPDGAIDGSAVCFEGGYKAVAGRRAIKSEGESKAVKTIYKQWLGEGEISDIKIGNAANWNEPSLKMEFNLKSSEYTNGTGDKLYLSPMMGLGIHENPFKNPERKFNVDLGPMNEVNYNISIAIPTGYKIEEMPKSAKVVFGENGLSFDYLTEIKGETIKFNVKFKQKMDFVEVNDYKDLQQFYSNMAAKLEEQVVLSKI